MAEFYQKITKNPHSDLLWNIPEQKQGSVNVIGGNGQSMRTVVKTVEFLGAKYPLKTVNVVLPDALQGKVPPAPGVIFLKSTESGSFAEGEELDRVIAGADYSIIIGDLSKNAITGRAVGSACQHSEKPLLITRDAVDLVAENGAERILLNEQVVFFASVAQLQKLLRAVYYPKMLLMSQSLVQVTEVLHKFSLSYPVGVVTLHEGQFLIAKDGQVNGVPLEESGYSPIMMWQGELAGKIAVLNLYNPRSFVPATTCAVFA